jgi:hypothetical protein
MADCSFTDVSVDWDFIESWGSTMLQGRSLKASLGRLCLGAIVYHFWRQRNDLLHCNTPCTEEFIIAQIK